MARWLVLGLALAIVGSIASACGSSAAASAESRKPAAQIYADALRASSSARSVHVTGTFTTNGQSIYEDLVIGQSQGGGSISIGGSRIGVFADSQWVDMNASASTWEALSKDPSSSKLADKWVEFPASSSFFSDLGINRLPDFVKSLFNQNPTHFVKGRLTTVHGVPAIPLTIPGQGSMYIASRGAPYLLGFQGDGLGAVFDQWNVASPPTPPVGATPAIDLLK